MVNSNIITFIVSAVGAFTGALIGNAFTSTSSSLSAPVSVLSVSKVAAGNAAPLAIQSQPEECPPAPPCPVCGAESATIASSENTGSAVVHGAAPAPPGSYNQRTFYPLAKTYNRFENWYDQRRTGKGVWKWTQYFPAWERHFAKFIAKSWAGEEVHMAELGIFSGGSLEMWQAVFGPGLRLWGVDIATVTKQYETDDTSGRTKIFNMDQTSAESWAEFKKAVPKLDILIDDGLHLFKGQKATFDNILDHIAPGGVFMTEDISDGTRPGKPASRSDGPEHVEKYLDYSFAKTRALHYAGSKVQDTIDSIHYYPYLFVVEKRPVALRPHGSAPPLTAIKHGTRWQPITHGVVRGQHASR